MTHDMNINNVLSPNLPGYANKKHDFICVLVIWMRLLTQQG